MGKFRRAAFALVLLALIFAADAPSTARAESYPIEALDATINLPGEWTVGPIAQAGPDAKMRDVFFAKRGEGRNTDYLSISGGESVRTDIPDNLDDADATSLEKLLYAFTSNSNLSDVQFVDAANALAICYTMDNWVYTGHGYGAFLRRGGVDISVRLSLSGPLSEAEYTSFRDIVASLAFGEALAPEPAEDPAAPAADRRTDAFAAAHAILAPEPTGQPATVAIDAWMAAYVSTLGGYIPDASVEYEATAARDGGTIEAMYAVRYGAYEASAVVEADRNGAIREIGFWFPCGLAYQAEDEDRSIQDLLLVLSAGKLLLPGTDEDALFGLMADLFIDILGTMDNGTAGEWIWESGVGFYAAYLPEAENALVVIRVP